MTTPARGRPRCWIHHPPFAAGFFFFNVSFSLLVVDLDSLHFFIWPFWQFENGLLWKHENCFYLHTWNATSLSQTTSRPPFFSNVITSFIEKYARLSSATSFPLLTFPRRRSFLSESISFSYFPLAHYTVAVGVLSLSCYGVRHHLPPWALLDAFSRRIYTVA